MTSACILSSEQTSQSAVSGLKPIELLAEFCMEAFIGPKFHYDRINNRIFNGSVEELSVSTVRCFSGDTYVGVEPSDRCGFVSALGLNSIVADQK